jgi:tetratricopeptide (TPR) repeat protein
MTKAAPFCVAITAEGPSSSTPSGEVARGAGAMKEAPKSGSGTVPSPAAATIPAKAGQSSSQVGSNSPADLKATRTKVFLAELEQLDKAIQEHPNDLSALRARVNINALAANWRAAEADLRRVIALDASDHFAYFRLAVVLAYLEDDAGYRKACVELVDRFAADPSDVTHERVGKACLLRPGALADMSRAYQIVDTLRGGTDSALPRQWRLLVVALCAYRRGEYQQAATILEQALRDEGGMGGDNKLGMTYMILVMARQRSGGHAEAKAALEQGLAIVERKAKQPNAGRTLLNWHDWLTVLTLAREARGLVDPARKPAGGMPDSQ